MRRLLLGRAILCIAVLSPCWAHADDQQIAQQIVQQLRQDKAEGRLSGFGIDLEVESGIVWLQGHVADREQHQRVLDIARHVPGVQQVVNDLEMVRGTGNPETNQARTRPAGALAEATATMLGKPGQLLTNLNRNVKGAFRPKDESEGPDAANSVEPVSAPPRSARTTPTAVTPVSQTRSATPTDVELAEEVIGRLGTQKDQGELRDFDIDVQVDNRVVWISGHVASEAQQSLVLDVARRVRGVKQVVNDLQVAHPAPARMASAAQDAGRMASAPNLSAPAPLSHAAVRSVPGSTPAPLAFARPSPWPTPSR